METRNLSVQARGITQNVLVGGAEDAAPVLLVHGNCSSADFWLPLVRRLPDGLRIVAPDLRGYGRSQAAPVDATRGLRDFADDVAALLDDRDLFPLDVPVVVAAHSMGCGVVMHLLAEHPGRFSAVLLEAPLSPYGFGGTRDLEGTPTTADYAGTGGGTANPDFVARIQSGDRSAEAPTSPLTVLRSAYVADPASLGEDEALLLDTVLSTAIGEDNYPGDFKPVTSWPGVGPGDRGVLNTMAPSHFNVATDLIDARAKPPIVWVRGDKDAIVSDTSLFDLAYLGSLDVVPGWPGAELCPPQPMVGQTRAVLDRYAEQGGSYREVVYDNCGHSPHIERPAEVTAELLNLVNAGGGRAH
ncbi:alpha/beta fold hydrolase [Actinoplanes sp. LDG1-06]|uniref:Alpha/beta fold hydrolase n=1 Tax=Paractinoplanes ovalisporus TaxID=2810368 RepID=A0ABS2A946_9ACTN|nr:alpha/beta fold hydrolase [Actinoplanes ovalisporus]MBM2615769.1 alpha/beta fold hydrolase [Actinoplanes ovalisporus]